MQFPILLGQPPINYNRGHKKHPKLRIRERFPHPLAGPMITPGRGSVKRDCGRRGSFSSLASSPNDNPSVFLHLQTDLCETAGGSGTRESSCTAAQTPIGQVRTTGLLTKSNLPGFMHFRGSY